MQILLLSFYFPPDIGPGSLRAKSILDALIEYGPKDINIDVVTTTPNRYRLYNQTAKNFEKNIGYNVHRIKIPKHKNQFFDQIKSFAYYAFKVLKLIKKKEYDVVISTSSRLMTATLGAYIAKKKNTKLYLDIRDLFADTMSSVLKDNSLRFVLPFIYFIEKWTFKSANRINIISGGFAKYFQGRYPLLKSSIYTHGIDEKFLDFKFLKNNSSAKYTILYAGNIGDGQGLHKIIPNVAFCNPNYHFKIIGDGSARIELIEHKLIKSLKNVEIIKPISRDKLFDEYASADILFIHLNNYEAFLKVLPSKIFEYAATNKPILAGVSGHSKNFLQNEILGSEVFNPCDHKAMSRCIKHIIEKKQSIDRREFIKKYRRKNIMRKMAEDIFTLI